MSGILTCQTKLSPIETVRKLREMLLDEPWSIRYCLRIIPIQNTVKTTISEIEAAKIMVRAFSEVEQALYIQNAVRDQLRAVSTAEQQAQAAYLLAFDRYQKGLVDLITVLNSQNQWRNTQSLQISFQKNQISSYINLLLALGGNF